jgi:hypothetical protein
MTPKDNERTLQALLAGIPQEDQAFATDYLKMLLGVTPPTLFRVVLPVARQLMNYTGWKAMVQNRLTPNALIAHCAKRNYALLLLRAIPDDDGYDPEAEFLAGITVCLVRDDRD